LLTSLLASTPAWRHLDPVPVLAPQEEKPGWSDEMNQEGVREEKAASMLFRNNESKSADRSTP
jgi:hypothetical protein